MAIESSNDGADIFWPGYVDAVTNLVLNLLFLLTIMTVAVFMFAMELSKHNKPAATTVAAQTPPELQAAPEETKAAQAEVEMLRKQVEALKKEAQQANELRTPQKVLPATSAMPNPEKSIDRTTPTGGGIVVRYTDEAVTLTSAEADRLRGALAPLVAGGARIEVIVPKGFSEAKRLGFYRAMAVRNLLLEMKLPPNRIDVSVREGGAGADAAAVRVMPR